MMECYIVRVKAVDVEYIGKYKDERAYSYWMSIHSLLILIRCTPGTAEACNHVLAVLYKINYAYNKQYISPACTSVSQGWNKGTRKEVNPSKVKNLTFRPNSWPQLNIEERI